MNSTYYKIKFTLDKKIRGRYEMPHTIELDKSLIKYGLMKCKNIWEYFECVDTFYNEMPNKLKGKLYKRKDCVDLMDNTPYFFSLKFVITEKVKSIFDELMINKDEYVLKEIDIINFNEKFFLLFIPVRKIEKIINFKNSYFEYRDDIVTFNDYSDYKTQSKVNIFNPKKLSIPKEFLELDIFNLQIGGVFLSERIIHAFEKNNVKGYDIEKGYFKVDLEFY